VKTSGLRRPHAFARFLPVGADAGAVPVQTESPEPLYLSDLAHFQQNRFTLLLEML
jgi:hypothetical protein